LDEAFDNAMAGWVGEKKWKAFPEVDKQQWRADRWESSLKRRFDGKDRIWPVQMPPHLLVHQKFSVRGMLKNKKKTGPPIQNTQLQLNRYVQFTSGFPSLLIMEYRADLVQIFDSSFEKIEALVKSQVKKCESEIHKNPKVCPPNL
jgi:hypothetical protein